MQSFKITKGFPKNSLVIKANFCKDWTPSQSILTIEVEPPIYCNVQYMSKYSEWMKNRSRRLYISVQKPACRKRWGGRSNASPPPHHHPISQLIRGYFVYRRCNHYSPPQCFFMDTNKRFLLNYAAFCILVVFARISPFLKLTYHCPTSH